jgi:Zn-dependent protease with chaperone function
MRSLWLVGAVASCALQLVAPLAPAEEKQKTHNFEGYAEYRKGGVLIVDGQRVVAGPAMKNKSKGGLDLENVPLGYEVKIKGVRQADGSVLALEFEAKPNGSAMFEGDALHATGELEQAFLRLGRLPREMGGSRLRTSGKEVDRVRRIALRMMPSYKDPDEFRFYVAGDWEWNAFACANGMVVVNVGLLEEMDDDEVALIVGHELAHATHEHTRRSMKKAMWGALITAGVQGAAEAIEDDELRTIAQGAAALGSLAWNNGYSRGLEDQADRVGMRYAYEAGFDVTKAPRLWRKFARKYGESDKVSNFFFGDHSLSLQRATHAEVQLAMNFPDAAERVNGARYADAKPQPSRPPAGAARTSKREAPERSAAVAGFAELLAEKGLTDAEGEPEPSESDMEWVEAYGAKAAELGDVVAKSMDGAPTIKAGMTPDEVKAILGKPMLSVEDMWVYASQTVLFENGKVKEIQPAAKKGRS